MSRPPMGASGNGKRLATELNEIGKLYEVEPVDDNLSHWYVVVPGPEKTPFSGYCFLVEVRFPDAYPFSAPSISFKTPMYHPNISKNGEICIGPFANWKSKNVVLEIIRFIENLLSDPDPNNPLNPEVAVLYITDKNEYESRVRSWAKQYAV